MADNDTTRASAQAAQSAAQVRQRAQLQRDADALGFDAIGVTPTEGLADAGARLMEFLNAGRHGDMAWMAQTAARRSHPNALWPEAMTAVVVGHSYAPAVDPMQRLEQTDRAVISAYAKGRDYHDVLKGKLKQLAGKLAARTGAEVKVFVDTAPLMEKPLAAAAGIGWQGKHTNLVSRAHGSWLFLGTILTTAELPADTAQRDLCGRCTRCLTVCPTDAFPAPYQLDARRCLAYLSIESRSQIPLEFRAPMGNRVFGCDDCLAVCPWNKFAKVSQEAKYAARSATDDPPIADLLVLDDAAFRKQFAGTPVKRTGRDRVVRNALVAAGNSGNPGLVSHVERLLQDDSPLVRGMAVWALARLCGPMQVATAARRLASLERDASVRTEWQREMTKSFEP